MSTKSISSHVLCFVLFLIVGISFISAPPADTEKITIKAISAWAAFLKKYPDIMPKLKELLTKQGQIPPPLY